MSGLVRVGDAGRGTDEYAIVVVVVLPVCKCMLPRAQAREWPSKMGLPDGSGWAVCGGVDAIGRSARSKNHGTSLEVVTRDC